MLKFACFVLVIASASALKLPSALLPRGIVEPVEECGGEGLFLQLRLTDCTVPPCNLVPDREYMLESDFVPRYACAELGFRLFLMVNDRIHSLYDVPVPGSSVQPGNTYTLRYPIVPDPELAGIDFDIIMHIYCTESREIEICVETQATIA